MPTIKADGLAELNARLQQLPGELKRVVERATEAGLYVLWESVPEYPNAPEGSSYIRTGMLGRSMGVAMEGGQMGRPDLFEVKPEGNFFTGTFGSTLFYAPDVIGESQEQPFAGYWWNILDVLDNARDKITEVFTAAMEELAKWIAGGR